MTSTLWRSTQAALLLGALLVPELAQAAPANLRCTAWSKTRDAQGVARCVQWTSGGLAAGEKLPPPPFMTQAPAAPQPAKAQAPAKQKKK